ncbi:MAG: hypothetical protein IPN42_16945 [Methylococcaceae bacterium]|nr:hypothetical protein [Methylococcaceae bacterium]
MKESNKPLTVALRGMDSRTVKTMKLFLFGPCDRVAEVVTNPEEAEIDIFDADIPSSKKILDQFTSEQFSKPFIVLSVMEYEHEKALFVKKPLNTDSMLKVMAIAKKQLIEIEKSNARKAKFEQIIEVVKDDVAESDVEKNNNINSSLSGELINKYIDPKVADVLKEVDDWFDF